MLSVFLIFFILQKIMLLKKRLQQPSLSTTSLSSAYAKNFQYNNIKQCDICKESFELSRPQSIIKCGHRFHKSCLNEWEYQSYPYSCPICRCRYDLFSKWDYIYCIVLY